MKSDNSDNTVEISVYKDIEYAEFIKTIKEGQVAHWKQIAEALNVDQDTITRWKNTKEAQDAINDGIAHALACMTQAGARDWRMWETKLKMFGINPATNLDVKSGGQPITALVEFIGSDDKEQSDADQDQSTDTPTV